MNYITPIIFKTVEKNKGGKIGADFYLQLMTELHLSRTTVVVHLKKLCTEKYITIVNGVISVNKAYPETKFKNHLLTRSAENLYFYISEFLFKHHRAPSVKELSNNLGFKEKTIRLQLYSLNSSGYIAYTRLDRNIQLTEKKLIERNDVQPVRHNRRKHASYTPRVSLEIVERISRFIEIREKCELDEIYKSLKLNKNTCRNRLSWMRKNDFVFYEKKTKLYSVKTPFRCFDYILFSQKEPPAYSHYSERTFGNGIPRYSLKKIELVYCAIEDYIDTYGFSPTVGEISGYTGDSKPVVWTCIKWLVDNDFLARIKYKKRAMVIKNPFNPTKWLENRLTDKKSTQNFDVFESQKKKRDQYKKFSEMGIDPKYSPNHYKITFGKIQG